MSQQWKNARVRKGSLKNRIIGISLLLFISIISISSYLNIKIVKENFSDALLEKSIQQVNEIARQAENILDSTSNPTVELQNFVENKVKQNGIAYAVIIDKNVTAIAHSDQEKIGKNYEDDPYSVDGAKNGKTMTSRFYADVQKSWTFDIMVPIYINNTLYGSMDVGIFEGDITEATNEDFLKSCELALLIIDSCYVSIFSKDESTIHKLFECATNFHYTNIKYITNENDAHTSLTVWG